MSQQDSTASGTKKRSSSSQIRGSEDEKWEQLLSAAVGRIIAAIERQGNSTAQAPHATLRVDLREQVTSQAPTLAKGYRLVIPGRCSGDPPRLSPKRSRDRDVASYSIEPFQYPDDIRLCDGFWYRIVWTDEHGQRIRMLAGESVPGLHYFVGPAQSALCEAKVESRDEPPAAHLLRQDSTPSPAGLETPDEIGALVNALAAQICAEARKKEDDARNAALDAAKKQVSLLATLPPQLIAVTKESERAAYATQPPLTLDDSSLVVRFVQQHEWMSQLVYEERLAAAQATGQSPPPEPPTSLSAHERKMIHELLTKRLPPPLLTFCKLLHAYARKHGPEVLDFLPTPLPPLPEAEQERLRNAILNMQKRKYLEYLHTRQELLLRGGSLPEEPVVSLSSKERQQLRRMLRDTRMVILFEKQVHPPLMFFQG